MNHIEKFRKGLTGNAYMELFQKVVQENKTTGPNQSEAMAHYTRMNLTRSLRWFKNGELAEEVYDFLHAWEKPLKWIVQTEAWCGDAAHTVPFIQMMADASSQIEVRYLLRDDHLDLMDHYLTNNGRSIPKLIAMDEDGEVLFDWGPRPAELQEWYLKVKNEGLSFDEIKIGLQKWYNADKGVTAQYEIKNKIARLIE